MKRAEIVVAAVLLVGAGLTLRESLRLNVGWGPSGPGAGFFPFWLSVGLALSAAVVLIQALRAAASGTRFVAPGALASLLKVILPMAGMILLMEVVGFYVAAAIYLGFVMRWIGGHGWPLVIGVSLLFPVATYVVIERYFLVLLPQGYLDLSIRF